jgi:hypothetical protein
MHRPSSRDDQPSSPLIRRLDRAAGGINPFLIILMVGLIILIAVRVVTVGLSNLPITRVYPNCLTSPASAIGGAAGDREVLSAGLAARARRAAIGHHHPLAGLYLARFTQESIARGSPARSEWRPSRSCYSAGDAEPCRVSISADIAT